MYSILFLLEGKQFFFFFGFYENRNTCDIQSGQKEEEEKNIPELGLPTLATVY